MIDAAPYDGNEMEARLDNWGAWCRQRSGASKTSAFYKVLVAIGYQQENAYGYASATSVDAKDAELIDAAVRMVSDEPEHSWLVERFVWRRSGARALKEIRGKFRPYTIDRAKRLVFYAANRLRAKAEKV